MKPTSVLSTLITVVVFSTTYSLKAQVDLGTGQTPSYPTFFSSLAQYQACYCPTKFITPDFSNVLKSKRKEWTWARRANELNDLTFSEGQRIISNGDGSRVYTAGIFSGQVALGRDTLVSVGPGTFPVNLYVVANTAASGTYWAIQATGKTEKVTGMAIDAEGSFYVTGEFTEYIDFGGTVLTATNGTNKNVFLAKFDQSGNFLWGRMPETLQSFDNSESGDVAVDSEGNVYLTGTYKGGVAFGEDTLIDEFGFNHAFVVKYSSAGDIVWVRGESGFFSFSFGKGIEVDTNDNVHVTGRFIGPADFGSNLLSTGGSFIYKVFVTKYVSDGTNIWATQAAEDGEYSEGVAIDVDQDGNAYVALSIRNGVTIFGEDTLDPAGVERKAALAKFDKDGTYLWSAQESAETTVSEVIDISLDKNGSPFIVGNFRLGDARFGNLNLDNPTTDGTKLFLVKYRPDGHASLAKREVSDEQLAVSKGQGVYVDGTTNVFVTGLGIGSLKFRSCKTFSLISQETNSFGIVAKTSIFNCPTFWQTTFNKNAVAEIDFAVYPNPVDQQLSVDYYFPEAELGEDEFVLRVFDARGSLIEELQLNASQFHSNINTVSWSEGLYFISIWKNGEKVKTERVAKGR